MDITIADLWCGCGSLSKDEILIFEGMQWDIQNSLVDALATFLLLSYVTFLSVSFDTLMPTFLMAKWGHQKSIMLYNGEIVKYFRKVFAILAIAILFTFLFPCLVGIFKGS